MRENRQLRDAQLAAQSQADHEAALRREALRHRSLKQFFEAATAEEVQQWRTAQQQASAAKAEERRLACR